MVLPVKGELDRLLHRSSDSRLPGAGASIAVCLSRAESESDAGAIPVAVLVQLAPILGEYIRSCLCSALLPPCPDPAGEQLRAVGNDYDSQARLQDHAGVQLERAEVRDDVSQSAVLVFLPAFCAHLRAVDRERLLPAIPTV